MGTKGFVVQELDMAVTRLCIDGITTSTIR